MGSEQHTSFLLELSEALDDKQIAKKFQDIVAPLMRPLMDSIERTQATIASLKSDLEAKDGIIASLQQRVDDLEVRIDDQEQQGRRGSMRVFGIPEDTTGELDAKVLTLINNHLKVQPQLALEDLEVVHRVGKAPESTEASSDASQEPTPSKPRPILVKFASRRTKTRVMKMKKTLKDNPLTKDDGSVIPVYIADDLTKRRAGLAFRARQLKRSGRISDTWTFDSKVLLKDLHGHIKLITKEGDIKKYEAPGNN